jgi:hypothetical protein
MLPVSHQHQHQLPITMIKNPKSTVFLDVFLKPHPDLKVGVVTDHHRFLVHDEFGKSEGWFVSGTVRALSKMRNGTLHAIVEDEDLDALVPTLRHR